MKAILGEYQHELEVADRKKVKYRERHTLREENTAENEIRQALL